MTHPHRLPRGALDLGRRGAVRRGAAPLPQARSSPAPRAEFVAAKLAERDERHIRMGDSRYVVEPNVKDGKGGLRDLHTLYWIGKYVHGVERPADLVDAGPAHRRRVPPVRARRALLLGGPLPPAPGRRAGRGAAGLRPPAADRRGDALRRPAGQIGGRALHAILFPQRQDGRRPDRPVPRPARRADGPRRAAASPCRPSCAGRPSVCTASCSTAAGCRFPTSNFCAKDPVRLIELFALAAREGLEIHPTAMRAAARDARLIDAGARRPARQRASSSKC